MIVKDDPLGTPRGSAISTAPSTPPTTAPRTLSAAVTRTIRPALGVGITLKSPVSFNVRLGSTARRPVAASLGVPICHSAPTAICLEPFEKRACGFALVIGEASFNLAEIRAHELHQFL